MKVRFVALGALSVSLLETAALAESCIIEITGPADRWKFVRVYDVANGEIVLEQAIRATDSRTVTVSGDQVRVDWKLPGYTEYRTGEVTTCRAGNTIRV